MRILIIAVGFERINMQWINGRVRETIHLGALLGGDYGNRGIVGVRCRSCQ